MSRILSRLPLTLQAPPGQPGTRDFVLSAITSQTGANRRTADELLTLLASFVLDVENDGMRTLRISFPGGTQPPEPYARLSKPAHQLLTIIMPYTHPTNFTLLYEWIMHHLVGQDSAYRALHHRHDIDFPQENRCRLEIA